MGLFKGYTGVWGSWVPGNRELRGLEAGNSGLRGLGVKGLGVEGVQARSRARA